MSVPIVGPVAPYTNPPINPQYYQPSVFDISAISLGLTTTVTTTVAHNYVIGQLCRLLIPSNFGSIQLNYQQAYVISLPSTTQVELKLDSRDSAAFTTSATGTQAQIIAVGDTNSGQINSSGRTGQVTNVPGSFINISPN